MPPVQGPFYGSIPRGEDDADGGPPASISTREQDDNRRFPRCLWILVTSAAVVIVLIGCVGVHRKTSLCHTFCANLLKLRSPTSSPSQQSTTSSSIPFPYVDRSQYSSTPVSDIVDPHLFDPSLRSSDSSTSVSISNTSSSSLLKFPFPTGAFWTNLVLVKATSDQGLSYPIMAYPYAYKWSSSMLQVSYPPLRRLMDQISIRDIFNPDMTISVKETTTARHVTAFDPLSVTLRFSTTDDENHYWESYLVQGSPFVTVAYENTTPVLSALSIFSKFECLEQQDNCQQQDITSNTLELRGTHFKVTTQEQLTWLIMTSTPITLAYDKIRKTTISANLAYQGVFRLVLLPPPLDYTQPESMSLPFPTAYDSIEESDKAIQQLICYAHVYPVGAQVAWESTKQNVGTVQFKFQTQSLGQQKSTQQRCHQQKNQLLMLALPHHAQVLPSTTLLHEFGELVAFRTIKGTMVPVVGDVWSYDEPLTTIGFDTSSTLKNAHALQDHTKSTILKQVHQDMSRVLPTLDENVYGFGKQVSRLAQLAHIASVLEDQPQYEQGDNNDGGDLSSLTLTITKVLHRYLSAYLSGQNRDKLLYDVNFGGIVSINGLQDFMDDFGNGWYNDHLFHYGYIMYASAVLGKLNSTFVEELGDSVDAILLDVANPANADSKTSQGQNTPHDLFPFTRHKSWFDSHSFASGLFPFADGKSMESSGESVNFYYGAYLWTTVRASGDNHQQHNGDEVDWARLLLAMEIRGVKTYWHMVNPDDDVDIYHASDIYNPKFAENLMVGNVGMMDVTIATWFGIEPLYVHMINFLPVTAITKELFEKRYVEEEFKNIISPVYDNVEMAWKGYVVSDRAMVNPSAAWKDALNLKSYELDQAISQSQVMYFASTMDGFVAPETHTKDTDNTSTASNEGSAASCDQNNACAELGLTGNCCPANNGAFLGCCGGMDLEHPPKSSSSTASNEGSPASCNQNNACAELGLTGNCCPTNNGAFLGCCGDANQGQKGGDSTKPTPTPEALPTTTGGSSSCAENKACADLGLTGLCCPTLEGEALGCCD